MRTTGRTRTRRSVWPTWLGPIRSSTPAGGDGVMTADERRTLDGPGLEFTMSENPWSPAAVVAEINEQRHCGLELVGLAEQQGGTSSAAYIRWPDGRQGALSRSSMPVERIRQSAEVLTAVRNRGLPVPRHDLIFEASDGMLAIVQERLPGQPASRVDAVMMDQMAAMNESFAGLLADQPGVPPPPAFAPTRYSDAQWNGTIGRLGERGQRLLAQLKRLSGGERYRITGNDLVHPDYGLGNILWDGHGHITGVVDWNWGAARGDRRFALLRLERNLAREGELYGAEPAAYQRLDEILANVIDPITLRIYRAHLAVEAAHQAICDDRSSETIERELRQAERS